MLIGISEGNQEEVNLKEESLLVNRVLLHQCAHLCPECCASGSLCQAFHRPEPFCPILGLVTFLCENDISVQLEGLMLLACKKHPVCVVLLSLSKLSYLLFLTGIPFPTLVLQLFGEVLQKECPQSLCSTLWRNQTSYPQQ